MKKLFLLILAALFMFSCGEGTGSDTDADTDTYEPEDTSCELDCNDDETDSEAPDEKSDDINDSDNQENPEEPDGSDTETPEQDSDNADPEDNETDDSDGDSENHDQDGDSSENPDENGDGDSDGSGHNDNDSEENDADTDNTETPEECDGVNSSTVEWKGKTGSVSVSGCALRTYTLTTNAELRDNYPESKQRIISETAGSPILRSGNSMLDALFALAITELNENKVSAITDYSMNNNQPVDCECFETGANWHYVWTRDTAYAVHSGIAFLEPQRSKNSLKFKISEPKSIVGGKLNKQIVQDTGSGGSWPVSTDRVVWMLGAYETLKNLDGSEYEEFLQESFEAIKNTLEADRLYVFDENDGLYRGEQSFLDWREQTYPLWTAQNTKHIGMSKTLSTNVLHYIALNMAASLAEELHEDSYVETFRSQAWFLLQAIKSAFYIDIPELGKKTFASMKTTFLDYSKVDKRDLLGLSLLILGSNAAIAEGNEEMAAEIFSGILEEYPVTEAGPSVIFPQEPQRKIYHNRAIWPFVTSYALRAAAKVENDRFYENAFMSLVRGAAFNLSNMENFEFTTLDAWHEDNWVDFQGEHMSGPVVNSRRQLWSVGGFISMVLDVLFGRDQTLKGLWFSPKIPVNLRNTFFADSSEMTLKNLKFKGKTIELKIILPPKNSETSGFYVLDSLQLNGVAKTEPLSEYDLDFTENNTIELHLKQVGSTGNANVFDCVNNSQTCWAPRAVENVSVAVDGDQLKVTFSPSEDAVSYNIYRDGKKVDNVTEASWYDHGYDMDYYDEFDYSKNSYCYSVSAVNAAGWESHHSDPVCYWGEGYWRTELQHNISGYAEWGAPNDILSVSNIQPTQSGTYIVALGYNNPAPISTGITSCNKIVEISEASSASPLASKMVFMPHLGNDNGGESSFFEVELTAGKTYKAVIKDAFNMSYFKHFELYTGGNGGGTDVYNKANIYKIEFLLKEIKN